MEGNKRVRRRRRNTVERLKNLLILLLTLSAVVLTVRVLMFNGLVDKGPRGWLDHLLSLLNPGQSVPADAPEATGQAGAAAQPVRIAVCDGVDRFAVQYDPAQADRLFSSVGILLSEALSSAASPHTVPESAWRDALQAPGVWFDFLGELPLEALYAWMGEGGSNPSLTATARQLAVAQDLDGGVSLYYHNESDGLYYACETEVAYTGHMDELVSGHGSNGAFFVFELEADRGYAGLDPYVLLTSATPSPLVYHSANPLSSPDEATISALQAAVSFQTQSDALYEIPGGLRLRVGRETLEIGNDGTVSYHTSEDAASRYPIGTTDGYTVSELVETTRRLAADTVGASCGAAQLYLMDITEGSMSVNENTELGENDYDEASDVQRAASVKVTTPVDPSTGIHKVVIIAKLSRYEKLKTALNDLGVTGMTVTQVMGCGVQKGAGEKYRGVEMDVTVLPKVKVEVIVGSISVEKVIDTVKRTLYTGHVGDGKIFVYNVQKVVKVRTGEEDYEALKDVE